MERVSHLPPFPQRDPAGNKSTFGRVLLIGGSTGMGGAIALAGLGALRTGAGLVTIAAPPDICRTATIIEPALLTVPVPEDSDGRIVFSALADLAPVITTQQAIAMGPGLGKSEGLAELVGHLFSDARCPAVFDADALNLLAGMKAFPDSAFPRVLTPHPGEFSRLTGLAVAEIQADRENHAHAFAEKHNVVVVLKGQGTVIADGSRVAVNTTGNSGMATAGSGDVLTGVIASLLAQMPAFDAAMLGAHLHGLAGDVAAEELSEAALIASDIPRFLGRAILRYG